MTSGQEVPAHEGRAQGHRPIHWYIQFTPYLNYPFFISKSVFLSLYKGEPEEEGVLTWEQFMKMGREAPKEVIEELDKR